MDIQIIKDSISRDELKKIAKDQFGDMVKAVVDIEQGIIAVGAELHADGEVLLMEREGSRREYIWGINLYVEKLGDDFIEFDSMINLKPALGNQTRGVENTDVRDKILTIIKKLVRD
jgi:hypothetical protein